MRDKVSNRFVDKAIWAASFQAGPFIHANLQTMFKMPLLNH